MNRIRRIGGAKSRRGYSLLELLVASAIMAVIVSWVLGFFGTQHETYVVVDQVSEAQQNIRAIAALIERDVRSAGYMVPPAAAACGQDSIGNPDILFVSDTNAIRPVDELPTSLRSQALSAEVTGNPGSGSSVSITVDDVVIDEEATYASGGGGNDADFDPNGGVILVDLANPDRGVACGILGDVNPPGNLVVNLPSTLAAGASNPPDVHAIPAVVYQITTPVATGIPELQRNGVTFARDVEDLQLAWFYDDDGDGEVDSSPSEYRGESGTVYTANTVDGNDLRELRFSLVIRTSIDDPRRDDAGTGQRTENRVNNVPGDDARHRRIHTATVRLRNIPI